MCYDQDGSVAGYCWIMKKGFQYELFRIKNTDAYVSECFVNSSYRGQGIAPAMLDEVCKQLRDKGLKSLTLSVRSYNTSAIKCYEKAGFIYTKKYTIVKLPRHGIALPYHTI